jgi:hypothetical protein
MKLKINLHNKRNCHQVEEAAQRMRDNLCCPQNGVNNQNINGAQKNKLSKKSMTQ